LAFVNVPPMPPLPPAVINPENVVTYVQAPNVPSLAAFLNNGTASYNITLMSSKLEAWRQSYQTQFPTFDGFTILMPRGTYQVSVTTNFTDGGRWYRGPTEVLPAQTGIVAMSSPRNPLSEATFNLPRSTTQTGFTYPSGYNGASTGAIQFYTFLQQTAGFTILQDGNVFWFRSNADPNDWFVCVRR